MIFANPTRKIPRWLRSQLRLVKLRTNTLRKNGRRRWTLASRTHALGSSGNFCATLAGNELTNRRISQFNLGRKSSRRYVPLRIVLIVSTPRLVHISQIDNLAALRGKSSSTSWIRLLLHSPTTIQSRLSANPRTLQPQALMV